MAATTLNPTQLASALLELVQASTDVYWVFSETSQITIFVSPAFEAIWGYPADVPLRDPTIWTRAVHPEDRRRADDVFKARHETGRFDHIFRVVRPDGSIVWVRDRGWQVPGDDGPLFVGIAEDVSDRIKSQQDQEVLMNEVDHRAKNTLAILQSIVLQSRRGAETVDQFADSVVGRIQAIARTHDLLRAKHWRGALIGDVALDELRPYLATGERPNVLLSGAALVLTAKASAALALTLHELATNAAKYGSLSRPTGSLSVTWSRTADAIDIVWTERTDWPIAPPVRRGFGSALIERMITMQLDGSVALTFEPEGASCRIRLPIEHLASGTEPERRRQDADEPFDQTGRG